MLAIIAYALGVMYTPGPVNLLGLNVGINGQARQSVGFCLGVGTAMLAYLLVLGWAGAAWINDDALVVVSALGCSYIIYLACKIARSNTDFSTPANVSRLVSYRDGLVMQLLNPKAIVATLPITTLQFPAAGIHGLSLVMWAFGLAMLAAGAPGSYVVMGSLVYWSPWRFRSGLSMYGCRLPLLLVRTLADCSEKKRPEGAFHNG